MQSVSSLAAREVLFTNLHDRAVGIAMALGCRDLSKDVAQETMLVLATRYAGVQSPEDLVRLVNAICSNISRAVIRQRRNRAVLPIDEDRHESMRPSPAFLAIYGEAHAKLTSCVNCCSSRCQALIRLDLDEASTDAICRELKLSRSAVFTLRNRCVAEIRSVWRQHERRSKPPIQQCAR